MFMRIIVAILFTLMAAGPARSQIVVMVPHVPHLPAADVGSYDNIRTVAVISGVGTTVTLQRTGFFGGKRKQLDIADFNVDRQVEATIRQYIGGRFAFKDVGYNPADVAALPNGALTNAYPGMRQYLRGLQTDGIDAFIVVRPDTLYDGPIFAGLAVENDGDRVPVVWANYEIDIVDARTFETISKSYSRIQIRSSQPAFAGVIGSNALRFNDELTPTDAQRSELRAFIYRLMPMSLLETLRSLDTGASLPAVGERVTMPIPAADDPLTDVKTIAVISTIGNRLDYKREAVIGKDNLDSITIADWGLDEQIEKQAREAVTTRFIVKDIEADRAQLASSRLLDDNRRLAPSFPSLQARDDIDAYLLAVKLPLNAGSGVGIWRSGGLLVDHVEVFAYYAFVLVNARTLEIMRIGRAAMSPNSPTAIPARDVSKTLWPTSPSELRRDQAEGIRQVAIELLADSVSETLLRMRMTGRYIVDTWPIDTGEATQIAAP